MDILDSTSSTVPVAALLPVVNIKQQLVALCPNLDVVSTEEVLQLLQQFKEIDFFDKLAGVSLLLSIPDPLILPADLDGRVASSRLMFCVSEHSCADPEVQTRLKYLLSHGYRILIGDLPSKTELSWNGSKAVAVDCSTGVPFYVKPLLSGLNGGLHWAKQIANPLQLQDAIGAGFKIFSGDYAFAPPPKINSADTGARARLLKLLGLVSRDAESRELEELFKQDANLSFSLFKLVSSAAFAQTVKVSSFGQAINLLGRRQLQRWLQLLLYARQNEQGAGLNPLMPRAAFRASLMESVCQKNGGSKDEQDAAFMVGMFSLLHVLFGLPLSEVLQPLNLTDDVLGALLDRSGRLGSMLSLVESADTDKSDVNLQSLLDAGLDIDTYYRCVTKAYEWVNQVCQDM
ncbi:EAL and HDOD domain-containing protein [Undibacterium sp.]|jgi:EAL and modified HD-GYP domain-containing signal transduction protein|uniref:EAL and HDOD domain-containing protein n=1 Tax=Undibacterium sp. TaxID=1914977 RepID=UPI002CC92E24|nr:HDOD domain-containing protein [Undibacterium sp.]HTD06430.1 HDOD domain-containing protein [Undibacterium sp.]